MILTIGEGAAFGLSIVRNIILARLLTKEDFGVAATLAITIAMLEFTSKMAVERIIVQDRDGDKNRFLATAHYVQCIIAVLTSLCMFFAATPLAEIFGLSSDRWAFQLLALAPLFKGLENLDVRRMARDLRFGPSIVVEVLPQLIITLVAFPLAIWIRDYRVVLIFLIAKPFMSLAMSHLLSKRAYRWKFDSIYVSRILGFGWPILVNSLLMFGIYQADRLLVGTYYSMSDLAVYSVAGTLTLAPGLLFSKVVGSVMLPLLSKSQDNLAVFQDYYKLSVQLISAFSVFYALFTIVSAEALIVLIFGDKYAGGGVILAWLAAANAFRIIRTPTVIAALARADSKNPMFANMFRLTSLLFAAWAAILLQPLWVIAAMGLIGELLAFVASMVMLYKRERIPLAWSLCPAILATIVIAASGVGVWLGVHSAHWFVALGVALLGGLVAAGLLIIVFEESRQRVHSLLESFFRTE